MGLSIMWWRRQKGELELMQVLWFEEIPTSSIMEDAEWSLAKRRMFREKVLNAFNENERKEIRDIVCDVANRCADLLSSMAAWKLWDFVDTVNLIITETRRKELSFQSINTWESEVRSFQFVDAGLLNLYKHPNGTTSVGGYR